MKILYFSFLHPKIVPGGAQQVAYEMFLAAKSEGHEAFFLAAVDHTIKLNLSKPGAVITGFENNDGEHLFFPQKYDFNYFQINDERSLHFLSEYLQDISPDVVHFHHYHMISLDAIEIARKALPFARLIMHFHEMLAICLNDGQMITKSKQLCYSSSPIACHKCFPSLDPDFFSVRSMVIKSALFSIDFFVVPTRFLKNRYVDWGIEESKIFVIANGSMSSSVKTSSSVDYNRFGFFGQFVDNKGLNVIFDTILYLAKLNRNGRHIHFDINGSNLQYASTENRERFNEMRKNVMEFEKIGIFINFRGEYNRENIADRMSYVDWVLIPSTWWETFALVLSEAWIFGKIPIVSNIGALKERVVHKYNGLLFPVSDAHALARLILECCYNKSLFDSMYHNIARPETHIDMFNNHLTSVYEQID